MESSKNFEQGKNPFLMSIDFNYKSKKYEIDLVNKER